jgi:hypothetical protein
MRQSITGQALTVVEVPLLDGFHGDLTMRKWDAKAVIDSIGPSSAKKALWLSQNDLRAAWLSSVF